MSPKQIAPPLRVAATVAAAVALVAASPAAPAHAASTLSRTSDATYQTNGAVLDVLTVGGITYVAGNFSAVRPSGAAPGSREVRRVDLAAFRSDGSVLTSWAPRTNGTVESLAVGADGNIYLGGSFTTVNGVARSRVAAVTPAGGLTRFRADANGTVKAVVVKGRTVYLGGSFSSVNRVTRARLAAVDSATSSVSGTWRPRADDTVLALALAPDNRSVYAGGLFRSINGATSKRKLAKLNSATGAPRAWGSTPSYPVTSVVASGTRVYVGGDGAGGHAGGYTADGKRLWQVQTDGGVNAVAVLGGVVYIGGHFDNVCRGDTAGSTSGFTCRENRAVRKKILAVDADNAALDSWDPSANSVIGVMTLEASAPGQALRLRAGGLFTKLGRVPGSNVQRNQQGFGVFSR